MARHVDYKTDGHADQKPDKTIPDPEHEREESTVRDDGAIRGAADGASGCRNRQGVIVALLEAVPAPFALAVNVRAAGLARSAMVKATALPQSWQRINSMWVPLCDSAG